MSLEAYYKTWHLQGFKEVPSSFPPPFNQPTREYGDMRDVQGMFNQDQSTEARIASAQGINTRGRFACLPSANLLPGDVLRSEELGIFIRLEGDPLVAPEFALTQVKTYAAYATSRSDEELAARRLAGLDDMEDAAE